LSKQCDCYYATTPVGRRHQAMLLSDVCRVHRA